LIVRGELLPAAQMGDLLDEATLKNQLCNIIGQSVATASDRRKQPPK
jgi:hypothetical protein